MACLRKSYIRQLIKRKERMLKNIELLNKQLEKMEAEINGKTK